MNCCVKCQQRTQFAGASVLERAACANRTFAADTAGQRLTNAVTDNTGTTRTEQYAYDELNRLTSVNYGDGQT